MATKFNNWRDLRMQLRNQMTPEDKRAEALRLQNKQLFDEHNAGRK